MDPGEWSYSAAANASVIMFFPLYLTSKTLAKNTPNTCSPQMSPAEILPAFAQKLKSEFVLP